MLEALVRVENTTTKRKWLKISSLLEALKRCSSSRDLESGKRIHRQAVADGHHSSIYVSTALLDMYAKCGSGMVEARRIFDSMPNHDAASWNALILGYSAHGQGDLALDLFFNAMDCPPDRRSFVAAFAACAESAERAAGDEIAQAVLLEKGRSIHSQAAASGSDLDVFVASSCINMYAKLGKMSEAQILFERIEEPNIVCWNSLIMGYAENGQSDAALQIFDRLRSSGSVCAAPNARTYVAALTALGSKASSDRMKNKTKNTEISERRREIHSEAAIQGFQTNLFLCNSLVDMYVKGGSLNEARQVFDAMPRRDSVTWNALLAGYVDNGEDGLAVELFTTMLTTAADVVNPRTYVVALSACSTTADLETGRRIHGEICRRGFDQDVFVTTSLVDLYSKCGSLNLAELQFQSFPSSSQTTVLWNSLFGGCCRRADFVRMFELFQMMQEEGVRPDGVTFLTILTACGHGGLVDQGERLFQRMSSRFGVQRSIEHYHCVVDMFGRANQLHAAVEIIQNMPYRADVVTWTTLLAACHKWKNVVVGKVAYEELLKLGDVGQEASTYSLMANIYGIAGA